MDTDHNTSLKDQKEDIDMVEAETNLDDVFMTDPQDQTTVIADLLKWTYALSMRLIVSDATKISAKDVSMAIPVNLSMMSV